MTFAEMLGVVVIGLLGSGHCIGMCGPFSLAVSAGARGAGGLLARQLAYQIGKATAYVFIGILLLLASDAGGRMLGSFERMQNILAWVAGVAMIVAGAAYALEWRGPARWLSGGGFGARVCGMAGALWHSPSLMRSLLIGWVNGFLPCGLSLTALIYLASYGSAAGVAAGAYLFGLSTLPALFAAALIGRRLGAGTRRWGVRVAGVLLIGFGVLTLVRGEPSVHHWFHRHMVIEGGPMADPGDHAEHGEHVAP